MINIDSSTVSVETSVPNPKHPITIKVHCTTLATIWFSKYPLLNNKNIPTVINVITNANPLILLSISSENVTFFSFFFAPYYFLPKLFILSSYSQIKFDKSV